MLEIVSDFSAASAASGNATALLDPETPPPTLAIILSSLLIVVREVLWKSLEATRHTLPQKLRSLPLLHLSAATLLFFFLVVLILLWLWRNRVSRQNQFWGLKRPVHCWQALDRSGGRPLYCSGCHQLISGFWIFRNRNGWSCLICGRCSHVRCLPQCEKLECKSPAHIPGKPLKHQLVEGNLEADAVCCVCGIICSSPFGLYGLQCIWCGRRWHEKCVGYLPDTCDLGPLVKLILDPSLVKLSNANAMVRRTGNAIVTSSILKGPVSTKKRRLPQSLENGIERKRISLSKVSLVEKLPNSETVTRIGSAHVPKHSPPPSVEVVPGSLEPEPIPISSKGSVGAAPMKKRAKFRNRLVPLSFSASSATDGILQELLRLTPAQADVWEIDAIAVKRIFAHLDDQRIRGDASQRHVLIVFVNMKSGGQMGSALIRDFYRLLNPLQVVDLQAEGGPARALERFRAVAEANRLRALVCGGDGTAGWVIHEIRRLFPPRSGIAIPVAVLPMGTGNDLARVLGWGDRFDGELARFLARILSAQIRFLDTWKVQVRNRGYESSVGNKPVNKPHCFTGMMNNYLDVGIAAKIALKFHTLRESHPELFQSRLGNKFLYGEMGVREWVTADKNEDDLSGIRIFCDGLPVVLPEKRIQGLIVVNIASFSGGVNLWPTDDAVDAAAIDFRRYGRLWDELPSDQKMARPRAQHYHHHLRESDLFHHGRAPRLRNRRNFRDHGALPLLCERPNSNQALTRPVPDFSEAVGEDTQLGSSPPRTHSRVIQQPHSAIADVHASNEELYCRYDVDDTSSETAWRDGRPPGTTATREHTARRKSGKRGASVRELSPNFGRRTSMRRVASQQALAREKDAVVPSSSSSLDLEIYVDATSSHPKHTDTIQRESAQREKRRGFVTSSPNDGTAGAPERQKVEISGRTKKSLHGSTLPRRSINISQDDVTPIHTHNSNLHQSRGVVEIQDEEHCPMSPSRHLKDVSAFSQQNFPASRRSCLEDSTVSSRHLSMAKNSCTRLGGLFRRWQQQSSRDEVIEVVAVRSLFHLGQVQVGLAEPLRVCQGRQLRIELPATPVALQIDGEPHMLSPGTNIDITFDGKAQVLCPLHSPNDTLLSTVSEVLDIAVRDSLLSNFQRNCLLWELSKRV